MDSLTGGTSMDERKQAEIVPLNQELYKDLSIDDLEQRLELDCWGINLCGAQCDTQCGAYCATLCGAQCSGFLCDNDYPV
jgi:hypothetical protein